MRKMCTLITSKATDIDENIANQNHATRTRTPKPEYLNLSIEARLVAKLSRMIHRPYRSFLETFQKFFLNRFIQLCCNQSFGLKSFKSSDWKLWDKKELA